MKKLTEIYGIKEGPYDDLNKQLAGATSVAGSGGARGKADPRYKKTQDDLNASQSVAKREAYGSGADEIKRELTSGKMDTYACIARAVKMAGSGKDPVEVASALHDVLYGEGSRPQPVGGGQETGQSVFTSTSSAGRAVGGLKLQ